MTLIFKGKKKKIQKLDKVLFFLFIHQLNRNKFYLILLKIFKF
jgi:hypothetical protein